jgi:hypothetical protein
VTVAEEALVCAECEIDSEGRAPGWRAFPGVNDYDTVDVVVLCPECARRGVDDA